MDSYILQCKDENIRHYAFCVGQWHIAVSNNLFRKDPESSQGKFSFQEKEGLTTVEVERLHTP